MKRKAPDLGWLVTLSVLGTTVVIGLVGSGLGAEPRTALWFVVGAVLAVGLALLRGQAAGLGEIIDLLLEIRERLEHERM